MAIQDLDEVVLLQRCRKGEESALKQLIHQHEQSVFAMVLHLGACDRDHAYEATVSSFVEAIRELQASGSDGPFLRELLPIVVRKTRDLKPSPKFEDPSAAGLPPEQRQLLQVVKQVLLALSFQSRLLLVLRDQIGLRYEDIAAILEVSMKEARSSVIQARSQLRDKTREALDRIR